MDAKEVRQLVDAGGLANFSVDAHERNGLLVINDLVALRVRCDVSMSRSIDMDLLAEDQSILGTLVFTSRGGSRQQNNKSDYVLTAYLTEQAYLDFDLSRDLEYDYLVLNKADLDLYFGEYAETSAIWGGFAHIKDDGARVLRSIKEIEAKSGMRLPLSPSKTLCQRAVSSAHPFERFLKHYHQLELLCDWYVARQIARLPSDLNGFGKIISSYNAGDFSRVRDLVATFCTDTASVRNQVNQVSPFQKTAQAMFQDFGKQGNPLKDGITWSNGIPAVPDAVLLSLAAYWVFRVRCSIAHHRVGEYLIDDGDEDFVVEFAEPLLLEIIRQVLTNRKLHDLI